ncbi:MAG: hypothetical protein WC450_11545, partial [Candidatus Omnitrophota bacterium]
MGIYLKPKASLVRRLIEAEYSEIPTELVNDLVNAVVDKTTIRPDMTADDLIKQMANTIQVTALSTVALAGGSHAINKALAKTLPSDQKQTFNQAAQDVLNNGGTAREAAKSGIDAVTVTPDGKTFIDTQISKMKEEALREEQSNRNDQPFIFGVNEDVSGEVSTFTMADPVTGQTFEVPALKTEEKDTVNIKPDMAQVKIKIDELRKGEGIDTQIDKLIQGEEDIDQVAGKIFGETEQLDDVPDFAEEVKPETILARVKSINDSIGEKGSVDLASLVDLGRSIWAEGHQSIEAFTARAKELLGDVWNKVQYHIQAAWNVLNNERGSVNIGGVTNKPGTANKPPETTPKAVGGNIKDAIPETKVIDHEGTPLTVYHATDQVFDEFDAAKLGVNTGAASAKEGFFFTNSSRAAALYPIYDPNTLLAEGGFLKKRLQPLVKSSERINIEDNIKDIQGKIKAIELKAEEYKEKVLKSIEANKKPGEWYTAAEAKQINDAFFTVYDQSKSLRKQKVELEQQIENLPESKQRKLQRELNEKHVEENNILAIGDRARKELIGIIKEAGKMQKLDPTLTAEDIYDFEKALKAGTENNEYVPPKQLEHLYAKAQPKIKEVEDAFDWNYKYSYSKQRWSGGDAATGEVWEADRENVTPNIKPVYLNIKNPFIHDQQGGYRDQTYYELIKEAKKLGHDGVIIKNTKDPIKMDVYVVFDKDQIIPKYSLPNPTRPPEVGGQSTLYSGVDPTQIIPILKSLTQNIKEAWPHLEALGLKAYESGKVTFKAWSAEMKSYLGDLWESFRGSMAQLWESVKAFNEQLGERGSFSTKEVKSQIRKITGQVKPSDKMVTEAEGLARKLKTESKVASAAERKLNAELKVAFKEAAQNAREAYKAGKEEELSKAKDRMNKLYRRQQSIRNVRDYFNFTDSDMNKISRKNPLFMSDFEFHEYINDARDKAVFLADNKQAKIELMMLIEDRRLQKVDNYRRAMQLPSINEMSTDQLRQFAKLLEPYQDDDVFLTQRELETVDRTDVLNGARTWREAREAMVKEIQTRHPEVELKDLAGVKVKWNDSWKWDSALREQDPFFELLVHDMTTAQLSAD